MLSMAVNAVHTWGNGKHVGTELLEEGVAHGICRGNARMWLELQQCMHEI
jgi:hypothetical protein